MIQSPFEFELGLSDSDLQKLAKLMLRWSHTEHIIANCLKVMLRLTDEEAVVIVFPLSTEQRLQKIAAIAEINPLNADASAAFKGLNFAMNALKPVRNNVAHSIMEEGEDGDHTFHNRAKQRNFKKSEVLSTEELTNYAAHAAIALRFALGWKNEAKSRHPLPERPELPLFLRS